MRKGSSSLLMAILMLSPLACSGEDGSGGTPFEPAPAPTISAIEPAEAAPGDRITIRGEFGPQAGQASVAIGGMQAEVKSRSATAIVAVVPEQSPGAVAVVVTVGDRTSDPFAFRVTAIPVPVITGIEPAQAHPGERITITGTNLDGPGVAVTVGGKRASVMSASPTTVVAVVPDLAPGTVAVVLTARHGTSAGFMYEVFQAIPIIDNVIPNPTRAGLPLTIYGRYLGAAAEARVWLGDVQLEIASRSDGQIVTQIPRATRVGTHRLEVQIGEERSAPFAFGVDDFSVTGTYDVRSVVVKVGQAVPQLCPVLPAVGTEKSLSIRLTDSRPLLDAVMGEDSLNGSVDSNGQFRATSSSAIQRISGSVTRRLDSGGTVYEIDMTIDHTGIFTICAYREHATGTRR